MRWQLPSLTASLVAFARASYATAPVPLDAGRDPVARDLLPLPLGLAARLLERGGTAADLARKGLESLSLGLLPHVALRTAAIDDAVREGVAQGIRQLVILGAGLDARAYRMPELAQTEVFEVDHPSTQAYKRARIEGHDPTARNVRFVSVDFERDRLAGALLHAGHDAGAPTFWIWEGVIMYLHPGAIDATLAQLTERSSAGSRLAATYITPELLAMGGKVPASLTRLVARTIGEPLHGVMPRAELHARLARHGGRVLSDESTDEWARRYWRAAEARRPRARERLVVAEF